MQRVGVVQQRFFDAHAERREQEASLHPLRVHERDARGRIAVRGVDRFQLPERGADVVAGPLAAEVLVETAGAGDGIERGIRDEAEDLVVDDHPLLAVDLGPLHQLRAVLGEVPDEGVGGLVVMVVGVEDVELDGTHGHLRDLERRF